MELLFYFVIFFFARRLVQRMNEEVDHEDTETDEMKATEPKYSARSTKPERTPSLESIKEQTRRLADQQALINRNKEVQQTVQPMKKRNAGKQKQADNPLEQWTKQRQQTSKRQRQARRSVHSEPSIDEVIASKQQSLRQREQRQTLSDERDERPFKRDTFYDELMSESFDEILEVERTQPAQSPSRTIDARALRQAVVMKEILDKPLSLRGE